MIILGIESIKSISQKLSIDYIGTEQDWDIESANHNRLEEFMDFYKINLLSNEEKKTLMALIIASYEDYLTSNEVDNFWDDIKKILINNLELFKDHINYWSLIDDKTSNDLFNITSLMRELLNN